MRFGAGWFRFVHVEFTPTCPRPALRIRCSPVTTAGRSFATRQFDRWPNARKFFPGSVRQRLGGVSPGSDSVGEFGGKRLLANPSRRTMYGDAVGVNFLL